MVPIAGYQELSLAISHGILWCRCITIGRHISLEAEKVNVSVVDVSAVPLKNLCLFCMLKFSSLGVTGNLMHYH